MSECNSCHKMTDHPLHTQTSCSYQGFLENMGRLKYESMVYGEDLREIQAEGRLPIEILDLAISPQDKYGGYIRLSYVPRWLKEGIIMYYNQQFADLTLLEFLQKMYP